MAEITIYHNPNFLAYRGDHDDITLPMQPLASIAVPETLPPLEMLNVGYVQTQHLDDAWFNNAAVTLRLRSTSVGDQIRLPDGSFYVVERMGFQPYQPSERKVEAAHHLCESSVLWEKANVGDLVGTEEVGLFRVIARKLRPKWRAKRLLACIPDAQIWIDGPETWAVLVPVDEQKYLS